MFKSIEEVRAFIEWAQTQKVKRIRVGDVEVEPLPSFQLETISDLPVVDSISGLGPLKATQEDKEDEELLYWSSSGKT